MEGVGPDEARCAVPECHGISHADATFREALWDRFFTAAPRPRTPSELLYSDSSLHRLFQRHEISRLPAIEGETGRKKAFKRYPIGYFHIDIAEVRTEEGKLHLFVAIGPANDPRSCPCRCRAALKFWHASRHSLPYSKLICSS